MVKTDGYLTVGSPHKIYWECHGNPKGIPLLFVHGGPGGYFKPDHCNLFDLDKWRLILFDQRGCGKSTPSGLLENNDTFSLISDMETLRQSLNIEKWALFGTSWGATLSLIYAIQHPYSVLGLMLRGTFLATYEEIDWFYHHGAPNFYPEEYEAWLQALPKNERIDPLKSYIDRIQRQDVEAARAWTRWHLSTLRLDYDKELIESIVKEGNPLNGPLIETHYLQNRYFLDEPNWILERAGVIKQPVSLIHGRHDLVCPLNNSWRLHRILPQSKLFVVQRGGHASSELATVETILNVQNSFLSS